MASASNAASLPERPGSGVDVEEWTLHHRVLYRLILGAPGSRTEDVQALYDAVAPVAYQGTTASSCSSRRWRRKLLDDLVDAGVIAVYDTPRGRVWIPTGDVDAVSAPP